MSFKKHLQIENNLSRQQGVMETNWEKAHLLMAQRDYSGDHSQTYKLLTSLQGKSFLERIEYARTLLFSGYIDSAKSLLLKLEMSTPDEWAERDLEMSKIYIYENDFDVAELLCRKWLAEAISSLTKLTFIQQLIHIALQKKAYEEAQILFEQGLAIATDHPRALVSFSLKAFHIKFLADLRFFEAAEEAYKIYRLELLAQFPKGPCHLYFKKLSLLRRGFWHVLQKTANLTTKISWLIENSEISRWVHEQHMQRKNEEDLQNLKEEVEFSGIEERVRSSICRNGFSFLRSESLIFNFVSKEAHDLQDKKVFLKALDILTIENKIDSEAFFIQVWELPYNKRTCDAVLRVTLSKIRALLPMQALVTEAGFLCLGKR